MAQYQEPRAQMVRLFGLHLYLAEWQKDVAKLPKVPVALGDNMVGRRNHIVLFHQ